jgi:hypothetical protein
MGPDQVIVASAGAALNGKLPTITYECGPLEQASIRDQVADILEGHSARFRGSRKTLTGIASLRQDTRPPELVL